MADASSLQTSFLGGEWSQSYQGRADLPAYGTAMNVCLNGIPLEEGAWGRRSGDRFAATTRAGVPGRIIDFDWSQSQPFSVEFTDGHLRFFSGAGGLVLSNDPQGILSISTANPAVVTTPGDNPWITGDMVQFNSTDASRGANMAILRNRQFSIVVLTANTFQIFDPITGAGIDGSTINFDPTDLTNQVARVLDLVSPYTGGNWASVKVVQSSQPNQLILLHPTVEPYVLTPGFNPNNPLQSGFAGTYGIFTLAPAVFADGPYLDPVAGSLATPSAKTGIITFTITFAAYAGGTTYPAGVTVTSSGLDYISLVDGNVGNTPASSPTYWSLVGVGSAVSQVGFQSTDIGRMIRIFSQPPTWAVGTAYTTGEAVTYNNAYYSAIAGSTGAQPDVSLSDWLPSPADATWSWGRITGIVSQTEVDIQLVGPDLLYTGSKSILVWQLGLYTATGPVYPTCGTYHEGRLWLTGAAVNRFDTSSSNDLFNMAPTGPDGTVADSNGISAIANSEDVETFVWMLPDHTGIIAGSQAGEWLVQASSLGDPITPTNIQIHRQTKFGCADVLPRRANLALLIVHRYGRKILEMVADYFASGRFFGRNLNERAKHLTPTVIEEITYVQELVPTIWARTGGGSLIGCTYKRESSFASEAPTEYGWHRHSLGSGRTIESLTSGPSVDGTYDTVGLVTNQTNSSDPHYNIRHVTYLSNMFQETDDIYHAAFVDDAVAPASAVFVGTAPNFTGVTFNGLWHLNGESVAAFVCGVDCGQFTVSNGSITVDFAGLFTLAQFESVAQSGESFGSLTVNIKEVQSTPHTPVAPVSPGTILSYIDTAAISGVSGDGLMLDWTNGYVYIAEDGSNTSGGVNKFQISSGTFIQGATCDTIFGNTSDSINSAPKWCGPDGNLYVTGNNYMHKISPALSRIASFPNDTSAAPTPTSVTAPSCICAVKAGNSTFLLGAGKNTSGGAAYLWAMDADTMLFAGHAEGLARYGQCIVPGFGGPGWGEAFTLAGLATTADSLNLYRTVVNEGAAAWPIASWPTVNPNISTLLVGTIMPADIDATWTNCTSLTPMLFDETDGNVIVILVTTDSVTNPRYMVKLSTKDCSLIWQLVLTEAMGSGNSNAWGMSRIRYNQVVIMEGGSSGVMKFIDTTTGAITYSESVPSCHGWVLGSAAFDDTTGTYLSQNTYDSGTSGAPVQAGSTPGTFSSQFCTISLGAGMKGYIPTVVVTNYSFPTGIGFTYTSQGQILRALSPQESGARNGPALAKTRRNFKFSALLTQTQGIQFGTEFADTHVPMRAAQFKSPGGTPFTLLQLYNGVYRGTIEARYDYDNMLCWQITRPYPAIVSAAGNFTHTQDL